MDSFTWADFEFKADKFNIMVGPSGCGKTSYVKSKYPKILLVSHMDQLGTYDKDVHEGILFDDMAFQHMPRTAQIHIADMDDDRYIHIRYGMAFIPKGTLKICTTNIKDIFTEDAAIRRRCHVWDMQMACEGVIV